VQRLGTVVRHRKIVLVERMLMEVVLLEVVVVENVVVEVKD
jgi:hypothetical protein